MPFCTAYGCKKSLTNVNNNTARISFYNLKKDDNSREKQWIKNIRREGDLPKKSGFYICSEHFAADCLKLTDR